MAKSVTQQMNSILKDYNREVIDTTNDVYKKVAKEAVQKLKNTSPIRKVNGGAYARSWSMKTGKGGAFRVNNVVIHNKDHYRLTHLLENGHDVIRNGKKIGRANPIKHIAPVEEWAIDEAFNNIKRELT